MPANLPNPKKPPPPSQPAEAAIPDGSRLDEEYDSLVRQAVAIPGLRGADQDDACQRAWIVILERIAGFRLDPHRGPLSSWLFVVARRVARNHLRGLCRRSRRESPMPTAALAEIADRGRSEDPDRQDPREIAVIQAVSSLSDRDRYVFERIALEGQSPRRLARELGQTSSAIRSRLHRIRLGLREAMPAASGS